jgi:hypothetical protein
VKNSAARVDEITRKLERVRVSSITLGILAAAILGLVVLGAAWFVISVLDIGLGIAGSVLRLVAVLLLVSALAALAYMLFKVFAVSHSIRAYAARVGVELEEIGLDLLTALDLSEVDRRELGYSQVLITRVIDDITRRLRGFDLQVSVRKRGVLIYLVPLAVIVMAGFLWLGYDEPSFAYSLRRLGFLWGLSDESGISISVSPGDDEILAGAALEISAEVTGFMRKTPILHIISGGEETAFMMEELDSLKGRGCRLYASMLPRVDRDIGYFVTVSDEATRLYRISVHEEPRIKGGSIRLTYPAHTGLGRQILPQGIWDITAPYGTEALIELQANCEPESIWIAAADSSGAKYDITVKASGDSMSFVRELNEDFTYSIEMIAGGGHRAKSHGPHSVTVVRDQYPYVRIESPGEEILLEADMIVPLSVVALDDYGISGMSLHYTCPGETAQVRLPYHGKTQARSDYNWDTAVLEVIPGDVITYFVSVADNDALTGPKYARTGVHVARVPTLYDFYQDIEDEQDESIEDLEEIAEETRELKEALDDIIEDMKRTSDFGWEEEQAVKQNLAEQDDIRERLEDVAQSLDETLDRMAENQLVNFEVIEKMEEIRRLFDDVATEEMRQALEKMQEAFEELSPEEIRAAMENINISQEELLQRLDRAIEMLKRLQLQQKMEAVTNLAENMAERQKEINEDMGEGCDLGEAREREAGLQDDLERLQDMMQELSDLLKEQQNPLSEDIDKAGEFTQTSKMSESMSMAMSSMSSGKRSQAEEQGESLEENLSQLACMLQAARDAMMGEEQRQIMEALTKAMHDLRDVSQRHEEVLCQIEEPGGRIPTSELARMEIVYKEALDRVAVDLFEVSRKSLFVSPMLGRAVLRIGSQLKSVSDLLSQGIRGRAEADVRSALGSMNELITGLMDAMDQASSCSSPSGMCDAFQSLENMCCTQMGINQGTQSLLDMGEQGLSMQARSQMARLAAEQETVRKGLDDLAREYGNRGEILGRFDDLAEEAKKVVEDLQNREVGPETMRRQERILTRMLNAQRSMRRRDYSERRKSRPGESYEKEPPPQLSQQEREELMRDLLYQRRGYYPPEYEDLIRAYFRAISAGKASQQ